MRDDFSAEVKRTLAHRAGNMCSNPTCKALTSGPQDDPARAINLGVASHITAAAPGGPRYDPNLSHDDRCGAANGIWLCNTCGKLIDSDLTRFSIELLNAWKTSTEDLARHSLGKPLDRPVSAPTLKLFLEEEGMRPNIYAPLELQRVLVLGLTNETNDTAFFPGIRYQRSCGLMVDPFGIDGSHNFGLPRGASDNEWVPFRGGADHVVYGQTTLKIAVLLQNGKNMGMEGIDASVYSRGPFNPTGKLLSRWVFDAVTVRFEISGRDMVTLPVEKLVPEAEEVI